MLIVKRKNLFGNLLLYIKTSNSSIFKLNCAFYTRHIVRSLVTSDEERKLMTKTTSFNFTKINPTTDVSKKIFVKVY